MAINVHNLRVYNMIVGAGSSGGEGGGGGASSKLLIGAVGFNSYAGRTYVYDASNLATTPTILAPSSTGDYLGALGSTSLNSVYTTLGSSGDDDLGSGAGAVYVYDSTNYSSSPTKLAPSGMISGNYMFGYSTLVTSNYIAAGALRDSTAGSSAGAVYIFNTSNLAATPTRLTVTKTGNDEFFGGGLAANSTQLIVGAEMYNDMKGAVYVYDPNNLSAAPTQLTASDLAGGNRFGSEIAATDSYIIVGAYNNDNSKGAVYVYDATNLAASPTKLVPSSAANDDFFGSSVAIYNNMIVVGAYGDDPMGSKSGNAFVYDASNLSAAPTELYPSDGSSNDQFGYSVSVDANYVAIGANGASSNTGAVYVYDSTNLSAAPTKLTGAANDRFGSSVSLG